MPKNKVDDARLIVVRRQDIINEIPGAAAFLKKVGADFSEDYEIANKILLIHTDNPPMAVREHRRGEAENWEHAKMEDDCPICKNLAKTKPKILIYDKDARLSLNADGVFSGIGTGKVH